MIFEEETPKDFIEYIAQQIGCINFDNFKSCIKDQFAIFKCPYAIAESKKREITSYIYFKCRMKNCNSNFKVKFRNDKLVSYSGFWIHNHPMNPRFVESMFCLLTKDVKQEITELRSKGASPYYIRKNLNLSISPNQLYNHSRDALKRFDNEISKLETEAERWNKDYIVTFQKYEEKFNGITLINRSMIDKPYSHDICVMDDTMCTNKYKYPIVLCFCYDENDKAQMVSLGILTGKTYNDFVDFLRIIANYIKFRVFICDRLKAQKKQ